MFLYPVPFLLGQLIWNFNLVDINKNSKDFWKFKKTHNQTKPPLQYLNLNTFYPS